MEPINPPDSSNSLGRTPATSEGEPTVFEIWKSYEQIAMHFNDLIIRMRVQALGGVAAIVAIAGIVLKEPQGVAVRWTLMGFAFLALIAFWAAVWALDRFYYTRLLYGAVDAILELEKQSQSRTRWKTIDLSTKIEDRLRGKAHEKLLGPQLFYLIVTLALLLMMIGSFIMGCLK